MSTKKDKTVDEVAPASSLVGAMLPLDSATKLDDKWAKQKQIAELVGQSVAAPIVGSMRKGQILAAALIIVVDGDYSTVKLLLPEMPANPTDEEREVVENRQQISLQLIAKKTGVLIQRTIDYFNTLWGNLRPGDNR